MERRAFLGFVAAAVATAAFVSPLCVQEVDEFAGTWSLTQPLSFDSKVLGGRVTVPVGFVTDFASVPRVPVVYLAEGGRGDKAAVIHDWLYTTQAVDRATADAVLREALVACGYGTGTAGAFWLAVRAFGGSHWKAPNQPQPVEVAAAIDQMSKAGG